MTDEMIALARRAGACKGWRWMPGMAHVGDERVVSFDDDRIVWFDVTKLRHSISDADPRDHLGPIYLPDLSDPATLGCLLALVREAWGDRYASVWCDTQFSTWEDRWVYSVDGTTKTGFSTEAEALVYALEAAP
jgi:hypothetical protein